MASAVLAQRVVAQAPLAASGSRAPVQQQRTAAAAARAPARCSGGARRAVAARATAQDKNVAAQKRWENQVRDGKVTNITCGDVPKMLEEGWVVLDVRPPSEVENAKLVGAVEVPLFIVDDDASPAGFLKQASNFSMGGWWLGGSHMKPNPQFMAEVQASIPKDASVIVTCQKGLRSLAACEQLSRAGYGPLAWINGGLDTAQPGQLNTKDGVDIRLGGVGGLSGVMGWTEAQREASRSEGFAGGALNLIKFAAVILAIDLIWFGYELVTSTDAVSQVSQALK